MVEFEQSVAGTGGYIEVKHNHRYTCLLYTSYNNVDDYTRRTFNADENYVKKAFILDKRHWSSETVADDGSGEYARVLDVYTSTAGAYGRPLKIEQQAYVLVHN